MKNIYLAVWLLCMAVTALHAQEKAEMQGPPPTPKAMETPTNQWLIGKWHGFSKSTMGTTEDWMQVEWALDNQFLLFHYRSKTVKANPEAMQEMAEKMKMPLEDLEKMMQREYKGMGLTTFNPVTGKLVGFWFDNYRDISQGEGTQDEETGSSVMQWQSPTYKMERRTEKLSENKLKVTFKGTDTMGMSFEGTAIMEREK